MTDTQLGVAGPGVWNSLWVSDSVWNETHASIRQHMQQWCFWDLHGECVCGSLWWLSSWPITSIKHRIQCL